MTNKDNEKRIKEFIKKEEYVEDKSKIGQTVVRFVSNKKETKEGKPEKRSSLEILLELLKKYGIEISYESPYSFDEIESVDYSDIVRSERNNMYFLVAYNGYNYGTGIFERDYKNDILTFFKLNKYGCQSGFWGCPWYFVDIENKDYKPGRPGLCYGRVIGNHAITLNEFLLIQAIFNYHEVEQSFKKEYDFVKPLYYCIKHDDITDVDFYLDKEGFSSQLMSKSCTIENKYSEWNNHRFISIENKEFEPVIPGYIKQFRVIGLKVITFFEFITIYKIYKKYEGKDLFVMEDGYDFRD